MKSVTLLLLIVVSICALTSASRPRPVCQTACSRIYDPVCATLKRGRVISRCTFANRCELAKQRCVRNENWVRVSNEKCRRNTRDCLKLLKSP
ncbi:vasotab-like [Drosophila mojavensis]|uniref:vasotab-like n=1 Tax=Drosophila mojavensis TaxID=7230 RepID=UPI001CD0C3EC|nr:vasotab-like [Drosophila mojavensis]